jgi:hypothetical protein
MTIDEYAATLPDTTNGADRVQWGLRFVYEHYGSLLQRLAGDSELPDGGENANGRGPNDHSNGHGKP